MIPKFTTPQAKLIRTLEGILVLAFNLAMVIVPIVSSALPAPTAVKYAAIVNTATVLARQLAKGIMAWQAPLLPAAPASAGVNADELEKRLSAHDAQIAQALPKAVDQALAARLARLSSDTAPDPYRAQAETTASRQAAAQSPAPPVTAP